MKKGTLSKERIARFDAIGFDFDPFTTQWEEKYLSLVAFKNKHDHCNVPKNMKTKLTFLTAISALVNFRFIANSVWITEQAIQKLENRE